MPGTSAALFATAYYLPATISTSADLAAKFPDWDVEKIESKTGITTRHIAAENETSADLAAEAAKALFARGGISPNDIDFLILCTQSPDYFLPPSACLLQQRLGLSRNVGAFDINLGCSGFVYGLGLAKGLIETGQARNVLLLTAETYSKFIGPQDRAVLSIFGDGAAASWVGAVETPQDDRPYIGNPLYGTDGSGAKHLIVERGAQRSPKRDEDAASFLYMNGPEIFRFTLDVVVANIKECMAKAGIDKDQVDLFVLHQANAFMLESLRIKLGVPKEKFTIQMRDTGNTVSATIPIALTDLARAGRIKPNATVLLSGFGVGLSWATVLLRWSPKFIA